MRVSLPPSFRMSLLSYFTTPSPFSLHYATKTKSFGSGFVEVKKKYVQTISYYIQTRRVELNPHVYRITM